MCGPLPLILSRVLRLITLVALFMGVNQMLLVLASSNLQLHLFNKGPVRFCQILSLVFDIMCIVYDVFAAIAFCSFGMVLSLLCCLITEHILCISMMILRIHTHHHPLGDTLIWRLICTHPPTPLGLADSHRQQ